MMNLSEYNQEISILQLKTVNPYILMYRKMFPDFLDKIMKIEQAKD